MKKLLLLLTLAGCHQNPSGRGEPIVVERFNVCKLATQYIVYADFKHDVCWVAKDAGNASISFSIPCNVVKQCQTEVNDE